MNYTHSEIDKILAELSSQLNNRTDTMIGYPVNLEYDYKDCWPLLAYSLNNLGDPFDPCPYRINCKELERDVLSFVSTLFSLPPDDAWGYITSGGTECNMYGLWLARERFPNAHLFYSQDTHYSIRKTAHLLRVEHTELPSRPNGEMDISKFENMLKHLNPSSVIISVNVGTTVKGAIDDVAGIVQVLKRQHIDRFHIHVDAALFGLMIPFWPKERRIDFTLPIDSMSISGHKFIGSPMPCGIALARKQYVDVVKHSVEYIGASDTTLSGSRSGHSALLLWYALAMLGKKGLKNRTKQCLSNAKYLADLLESHNIEYFLNDLSIIVVLEKPKPSVVSKWQLATEGKWAHVVVMPHVTREKINEFVTDIVDG